jgi:5-methylcytosine-specific restriction endonuclease McrA
VSDDDIYADTPETDTTIQWATKTINLRDLRKTHEYQTAQAQYRKECANRPQDDGTRGDKCIRDGEPIDYSLQYPHPLSWSLEHKIPASERLDLFWDRNNWASAHFVCNSINGAKGIESDIGTPSENW